MSDNTIYNFIVKCGHYEKVESVVESNSSPVTAFTGPVLLFDKNAD